ncbi:MAG: hypothetical protein KBC00_01185 [Candidatus Levybacteria bacterium]|nr:hypothetical protein [Candidatus Levybacteria bacterium]MBP9814950.1 hypothetical protein [Candidatus Levybacteria bacterium]
MGVESLGTQGENEIIGIDKTLPKYQTIHGAVSGLAKEEGVSKAMISKIVKRLGMNGRSLDKEDIAIIKHIRKHPNRGKSGRHFRKAG